MGELPVAGFRQRLGFDEGDPEASRGGVRTYESTGLGTRGVLPMQLRIEVRTKSREETEAGWSAADADHIVDVMLRRARIATARGRSGAPTACLAKPNGRPPEPVTLRE